MRTVCGLLHCPPSSDSFPDLLNLGEEKNADDFIASGKD